ncbi:MAG: DUF3899 domain-containing protein [Lachnospiraceae bacterium]|nr:DUF3899 domain-containing protein [Lachnospiraceae bacterium]
MKNVKILIQLVVGLLIAFFITWYQGAFVATKTSDIIMAVGDGFTVAAVLYLGMGALMWISTTGFFDIFGFAFKKAARVFIPNFMVDEEMNFLEYKMGKEEKRKGFSQYSSLIIGAIFLVVSIVLTAVWYMIAE